MEHARFTTLLLLSSVLILPACSSTTEEKVTETTAKNTVQNTISEEEADAVLEDAIAETEEVIAQLEKQAENSAPTPSKNSPEKITETSLKNNNMSEITEVTELKIETLTPGTGDAAKKGDTLSMHYTGTLLDGKKFDSSHDRGEPFQFILGAGQVIQGWDQGIEGMKIGEKRKLLIPYEMAYGERGFPPVIPPKSPLVFEIELIEMVR
jgi:FKBP-type peptidyl-prolyl cis-trans isomerase